MTPPEIIALNRVAERLEAIAEDMAHSGAMNLSLSLKAHAETIRGITEGSA